MKFSTVSTITLFLLLLSLSLEKRARRFSLEIYIYSLFFLREVFFSLFPRFTLVLSKVWIGCFAPWVVDYEVSLRTLGMLQSARLFSVPDAGFRKGREPRALQARKAGAFVSLYLCIFVECAKYQVGLL